jgi:hypothetical protein
MDEPAKKNKAISVVKLLPDGKCTDCGQHAPSGFTNRPCGNTVGKKQCKGVYKSKSDWIKCTTCQGTGEIASAKSGTPIIVECTSCGGKGWY